MMPRSTQRVSAKFTVRTQRIWKSPRLTGGRSMSKMTEGDYFGFRRLNELWAEGEEE